HHLGLENFAKALSKTAAEVFPNDKKSRYSQVFVLLISWQTRDPNLPVEQEISALRKVLEDCYHYDVEEYQIPDINSHLEVSDNFNSFVKVGNNSSSHLKIVYYAGHSRLSRSKELFLPTRKDSNCPIVMWSGIQRSLEMANSDVLILLDSCSSGVANDSEGNGVTELICACPFDSEANGVGHYSFTRALIIELRLLRTKPCFSVDELYTSIYVRMQFFLPQGIENERYPSPVHFVLTNDKPFVRGIKLSVQDARAPENEGLNGKRDIPRKATLVRHLKQTMQQNPPTTIIGVLLQKILCAPWALFTIRFREDIKGEDLSTEHFKEWLRSIPAAVEEVRVEAGLKSFSALLLVNMPGYVSLLYIILNQKSLLDIDWNRVAHDPILSREIRNSHATRMRYARFKKLMDGSPQAPN
ncbi:hypothetical protein BKA65DRAFT_579227, partial [Rhexocercosporidium sp. MPI-PUGE-AT-0058]